MWTKREKAMLKAMGRELKHQESLSCFYVRILEDMIRITVHAAREVKEPDYKAMWEELKRQWGDGKFGIITKLSDFMAEIERRHGGKA